MGEIIAIRFGTADDGTFKGFGYVTFSNAQQAEAAVNQLNGCDCGGRAMRVDFAPSKTKPRGAASNNNHNNNTCAEVTQDL